MTEFWVPHRVYLDTEPLRSAKWPRINNDLRLFLKSAAAFHLPCFVPEPVLRELEENWKREVATDEGHARELNLRYGLLGLPSAVLPSAAALLPAYRTAVGALLKDTGATVSPMSARPASDLFERSVTRGLTFTRDKDVGFQDCVILLSVLDHLPKGEPAVLVTKDPAFSAPHCLSHFTELGMDLRVVQTVDDVRNLLKAASQMVDDLKASNRRLKVYTQLLKRLDALSAYANEELVIAPVFFRGGSARMVGVSRVRLVGVDEESVQVGQLEKGANAVPISASFNASLNVFAETSRMAPIKTIKVGERDTPTPDDILRFLAPLQYEVEVNGVIAMDLEAPPDDQDFERMQPKAVYLKRVDPLEPPPGLGL